MKKSLKMFLIVIALVICIGGYITIVYTYKTNDKEVEQAMQGHPLSKFKYKDALAYAVA